MYACQTLHRGHRGELVPKSWRLIAVTIECKIVLTPASKKLEGLKYLQK